MWPCGRSEFTTWLDSLEDLCSKKVIKDFWDEHFSCVTAGGRAVDSHMNGFSGNLFAVLVCYLKVGVVGSGVIVGNAVFVNCTGDMATVFFNSISQTSAGFSYVTKVVIFILAGPFVDYVLF